MQFWESLYNFFFYSMGEAPPLYGAFHIFFCLMTVVFTVLVCKLYMKSDDKSLRKLIFILWVILAVLEVYKQVYYSIGVTDEGFTHSYQWSMFPFQLCATPLYTLPLIAFLPNGRVREAIISFVATYALFGGLVVMIYPGDVFLHVLGISLHTMIHHGIQCGIGIFFALKTITEAKKTKKRFLIEALVVFAIFIALALIVNVVGHYVLVASGNNQIFNMFYISPFHDTTLPVLSLFNSAPYPVILLLYLLGFTAAALLVYGIELGIYTLVGKMKKSKD